MEDEKIKSLFKNFEPELSSDFSFIARLQHNMDALELVKQHNTALRKRNKLAVLIAGAFGVVLGIISTLIFPLLSSWLSNIHFALSELQIAGIAFEPSLVGALTMAIVCVILTINAYELALSKLASREQFG